jgi:hypothetical protein
LSSDLPIRKPHPIRDYRRAVENHRTICGVRGYCGPFLNEEFYNAFPDPTWEGYGECVVCCSTCLIREEERKSREVANAEQTSLVVELSGR